MTQISSTRKTKATYRPEQGAGLLLLLVLLLGIGFVAVLVISAKQWELRSTQENFEKIANERRELLQRGLHGNLEILYSIGAFFKSSKLVEQEEFHSFVNDALVNHPEILALEWQQQVTQDQRASFEQKNRKNNLADFKIHQIDASGNTLPAASQPVYFPVQFSEPKVSEVARLGLDAPIAGLSISALQEALASHALIVSSDTYRAPRANTDSQPPSITVYLPVSRPSPALHDQVDSSTGFAVLTLDLQRLVANTLTQFNSPPMEVLLLGNEQPSRPDRSIFGGSPSGAPSAARPSDQRPHWNTELEVAGQKIPIRFKSQLDFQSSDLPWQLWAAGGTGLLFFAVTGGYLWANEKSHGRIERLNGKLLQEAEARATAAAKLQASEARLQKQNTVLLKLARQDAHSPTDIQSAFRDVTELASNTLAVARAGIWIYSDDRNSITNLDLFEANAHLHSSGQSVTVSICPSYFKAIDEERIVAVHDAMNDERTKELSDIYLRPLGVSSLLDAPIIHAGKTTGVVCLEHIGPARLWDPSEQAFASSLAEYVALLLETEARFAADTQRGRLAAIVEALPDAVAVTSASHQVIYLNRAAHDLLGLNPVAVLPENLVTALYSGDALRQQQEIVLPHALAHKVWSGESFVNGHEGAIPVQQIVIAHQDERGAVNYISTVLRDLRASKAAENDARERERFLSALVKNLPGVVYRRRNAPDWPMEYMSFGCLELTGYTAEQLMENRPNYSVLVHRDDHDRVYAEVAAAMQERRYFEVEYRLVRADGAIIWVWSKGHGIYGEDGELLAREGFIGDVNDRVIAQHNLEQLNAELEERIAERTRQLEDVNENLESFAYSVSHDLKAPLRGIDGYSRLLLEDYRENLPEEARGFLETIRTATERMNQIIDDLLAYSRLERRQLAISSFAVKCLLDRILAEREFEIKQLSVEIELQVEDDIAVKADLDGLLLVLRNLTDNAIKFSRTRTPPRIRFATQKQAHSVILSITDNGCGFEMKYHDRIFEIFQRLHRMEEFTGTGIGLAMVRKAMERMGGRVWAESTPGAGSTFFLELPK